MRQQALSIGGVGLQFRSAHEGFWACADRCYGGYFVANGKPPDDTVEVTVVGDAEVGVLQSSSWVRNITESNESLRLVLGRGIAEWKRGEGLARIRQPEADFQDGPPHPEYLCDTVLRAILAYRLAMAGGCLVHAASLVRNGMGYLFVGASGAGKSTIARLSASTCTVLSDDLSLVRRTAEGDRLFATPFLGEYPSPTSDQNAPLGAICFLRKASENALGRVSRRRAVRELLRSVLLPGQGRAVNQALLEVVVQLANCVSCYQLDFLPDSSFWGCLDERNRPDPE